MKAIITVLCVILLALAFFIGYHVGLSQASEQSTKDYQVASIMTTCCNNMIDNLGVDAEEIYSDYLDNLDCYNLSITKEDINKYNSWH